MKTVSVHRKHLHVGYSDKVVTYLDETATVSRWYEDPDYVETDQPTPYVDGSGQGRIGGPIHNVALLVNPESQDVEMTSGGPSLQKSPDRVGNSTARADARLHAVTPMHETHSRALLAATPRTESSATQGSPGSISSRSHSTVYPLSVATGPSNTILTQREAVLMRNFTDNMALWASFSSTLRQLIVCINANCRCRPTSLIEVATLRLTYLAGLYITPPCVTPYSPSLRVT